jgi:signal transduction histidine kinase
MKKHMGYGFVAICAIGALVLVILGADWGIELFSSLEELASHEDHAQLLESLRLAAVYSMSFGGMVVLGIGILVILFLHQIRSTNRLEKEAQALRRKNEAVEELNRQTRELAHHQRLETIGTLTSSIAHEFNNLLTPIMGYSLMALEKLPPEEE